jgi:hypothetical protein
MHGKAPKGPFYWHLLALYWHFIGTEAGVPDAVVMALVGHESTAMSHRYTHVGKEALARATRSLPEI